ncbi:hypothetical protein BDD12DRAFT_914367 [Trichophaea hybrida]|nr:hypothetical protein BDD12DRAFT_914367 [Trichophaea hybrida]
MSWLDASNLTSRTDKPRLENAPLPNSETTLYRTKPIRLEVIRSKGYHWSGGRGRGVDVIKDASESPRPTGTCEGNDYVRSTTDAATSQSRRATRAVPPAASYRDLRKLYSYDSNKSTGATRAPPLRSRTNRDKKRQILRRFGKADDMSEYRRLKWQADTMRDCRHERHPIVRPIRIVTMTSAARQLQLHSFPQHESQKRLPPETRKPKLERQVKGFEAEVVDAKQVSKIMKPRDSSAAGTRSLCQCGI